MLYYCIVARLLKQNIMQSITLTKIMNKKTYSFTFLKV